MEHVRHLIILGYFVNVCRHSYALWDGSGCRDSLVWTVFTRIKKDSTEKECRTKDAPQLTALLEKQTNLQIVFDCTSNGIPVGAFTAM